MFEMYSGNFIQLMLRSHYHANEAANLARIVCCDIFGQQQTDYHLGKGMELSEDEQRKFRRILAKLCMLEPIQYIMGTARFLCRDFQVEKGVLIPRPETEELVEMMIRELPQGASVLDIGTGSGCIAVSLSLERPDLEVTAWDVSEKALGIAGCNGDRLGSHIHCRLRDVLTYFPQDEERFDVIVSNPPYVLESERKEMEPNVLDYEPALALFVPDSDPLRFYRRIGDLGRRMLNPEGYIYFEINRRFGAETAELLRQQGYKEVEVRKDISQNDRFVVARK